MLAIPRHSARSTEVYIPKFCLSPLVAETVYGAKYRQERFRVGRRVILYVRSGTIKVTDTVIHFVNELPVGKPPALVRERPEPTGEIHYPWKLEYRELSRSIALILILREG